MRNQHDRCPAVAQGLHDPEQLLDFSGRQRRRRFIEDQEPQVSRQRAGDLDELKLGHRQPGDQRAGFDRDAKSRERLPRPRDCRLAVHGSERRYGRRAHADVLGDVQVGKKLRVLIDGGDARAPRLDRGREADDFAVQRDLARVGLKDAGDDLDQRGLSSAVLADERVNLAARHLETDVREGVRRAKGLGDASDPKGRLGHGRRSAAGPLRAEEAAEWRPGYRACGGFTVPPERVDRSLLVS